MRSSSRVCLACTVLVVGCGSEKRNGDEGDTDGVVVDPTPGQTATETDGDGGELPSAETDGTGGDGTGGGPVCETVLCGVPEMCCSEAEECAAGACMPVCESGVRCGSDLDVCCGDGQVCLGDQCADPRGECFDSFDCDFGEFCEPTVGRCLPQFDPVTCEANREFEAFETALEWSFTENQSISLPLVADIDGDGVQEVVLNTTREGGGDYPNGIIIVLDGQTGAEKWRIEHDPTSGSHGSHGRSTIGLGDVTGDGLPDIIYAGRAASGGSLIHAVDGMGNHLWSSHGADAEAYPLNVQNGAVSLANFDADPQTELVFGATLLDHDGLVVWDEGGGGTGAAAGSNDSYIGGISAIADLAGDEAPEIVSGRHAWSVDWQVGDAMAPQVTVTPLWAADGPDGYPAIADLDLDGDPEVVLVADGTVRVLEGATGHLWCGVDPSGAACEADDALRTQPVDVPGGGIGGPPTIADFDGDGRPEIAAAGGSSYTVYDLYREGEDVAHAQDSEPAPGELYIRWSRATQDQSSNATGSSVFDFQGDGAAEVVYADECYMRVYSGADGDVLLELESSSATIHEYPLVVDVDSDGNSEILVVANDEHTNCNHIDGYTLRRGVYVYGDAFDRWMRTRRVWTSHTYHVTNTTSAGTPPEVEVDNWTQPNLNNYRQNVQGEGVFNAPDLRVELSVGLANCLDRELVLIATVTNQGALGVPAGAEVSLYQGTDTTGTLLGTTETTVPLLPGGSTQFQWELPAPGRNTDYHAAVDGGGDGGVVLECDDSNNTSTISTSGCFTPG